MAAFHMGGRREGGARVATGPQGGARGRGSGRTRRVARAPRAEARGILCQRPPPPGRHGSPATVVRGVPLQPNSAASIKPRRTPHPSSPGLLLLLLRAPPDTCCSQDNPELEAAWKVLQFSWNRHFQGMWQALQVGGWVTGWSCVHGMPGDVCACASSCVRAQALTRGQENVPRRASGRM